MVIRTPGVVILAVIAWLTNRIFDVPVPLRRASGEGVMEAGAKYVLRGA